jgi:F-type H+-transporting ATPase subunit delta
MTELSTLARPYAEAAFKRSKETGSAQQWSDSLGFLVVLVQDEQLAEIIGNPRVTKDRLAQLVGDICAGQVDDEVINFVKVLVENSRLKLIAQIAELFERYKADDEGYVNVELFSAYALTKAEEKKYVSALEKQLAKKVKATVTIDKTLIGGVLARAGDKVIDGSISGQLQQLAKRL